jgi:hypothetical protein
MTDAYDSNTEYVLLQEYLNASRIYTSLKTKAQSLNDPHAKPGSAIKVAWQAADDERAEYFATYQKALKTYNSYRFQ